MDLSMRITVRTPSPWLSRLTRRRFEFALGRFSSRVRSVVVRIVDLNGPRGGVDKRCRATIHLQSSNREIVVEDVDADAAIAVDRAAARAARTVARAMDTASWRR
jgi:hypothetical protein